MMGSVGKIGKTSRSTRTDAECQSWHRHLRYCQGSSRAQGWKNRFSGSKKAGIVHVPVGKVSFGAGKKLLQNITAFIETILRLKPASSKGTYLKGIAVSTTMGPGISVDAAQVKDLVK